MNKVLLFPSPNWFQQSCLKVSVDEWLVYGGPGKSLCVLVPLPAEGKVSEAIEDQEEARGYHAHVQQKAHYEKIVSVDLCPEWPEKRHIISGSTDGAVKLWNVTFDDNNIEVKSSFSHDIHSKDKEEVVGVGYSTSQFAVTLSGFGTIVKWDVSINAVKVYRKKLWSFRPTCMACSPHTPLQVAIGTKQAVIVVMDLTQGYAKTIYKVRGHNDEVMHLSWCPQYEVEVKKAVQETLAMRLDRQRSANEEETETKEEENGAEEVNASDLSIVEEEDLFDMYKDHAADEFGHKKYVPEDIVVKIKDETPPNDFLTECNKLKTDILKLKNEPETSIESLVEALDNTTVSDETVDSKDDKVLPKEKTPKKASNMKDEAKNKEEKPKIFKGQPDEPTTTHIHHHMLASISKNGCVQLWSKSGKQVGTCFVSHTQSRQNVTTSTVLWYSADLMLVTDHKSQVLRINPLQLDSKNVLLFSIVHSLHRRNTYCLASSARRIQTRHTLPVWPIWSVAQDRSLIQYSLMENRAITTNSTCGGYVYNIATCPYDATKLAVAVGDGTLRVGNLSNLKNYWQNVQGKVLTCAWHPTQDNLLAFGTAEARVGILRPSDSVDRPAKLLQSVQSTAVYSISWSPQGLYVGAIKKLVLYDIKTGMGEAVPVTVEGATWPVADVQWTTKGLLVGSTDGGVALFSEGYTLQAATFPFTKLIHNMRWHPEQVSTSTEPSSHSDWLAICSFDKNIAILRLGTNEDGEPKFHNQCTLSGHFGPVFQVEWSPHYDSTLLSTSQDYTARIWSVSEGVCTHILHDLGGSVLCGAWSPEPHRSRQVMAGGAAYCIRLWDYTKHPSNLLTEKDLKVKKNRYKHKAAVGTITPVEPAAQSDEDEDHQTASLMQKDNSGKPRRFLLPTLEKELGAPHVNAARKMFRIYVAEKHGTPVQYGTEEEQRDTNYIKLLGTMNDVNEVLDMEQARHEEVAQTEGWLMLGVLRGRISDVIAYANTKGLYCSLLLALAPSVSNKFWKDTIQQYITRMDKLIAEGKGTGLEDNRRLGGPVIVSAALHLASGETGGAVSLFSSHGLHLAALLTARARHRADLVSAALHSALHSGLATQYSTAAVIHIYLNDLSQAARCLVKIKTIEALTLAVEIARENGEMTYADCVQKEIDVMKARSQKEELEALPSRLELLMRENRDVDKNAADREMKVDHIELNGTKKEEVADLGEINNEVELKLKEVNKDVEFNLEEVNKDVEF